MSNHYGRLCGNTILLSFYLNSTKMQKESVHNVAVVKLRLFSYTKINGVRTLYPLGVSTVRKNGCLFNLNLFLTSSPVLWHLYGSLIDLRQPHQGFIVIVGRVQSFLCVFVCSYQVTSLCFPVFPLTLCNVL